MPVAAADRDVSGRQACHQAIGAPQRGPSQLECQISASCGRSVQRLPPGAVGGERVVDRQQAAAGGDRATHSSAGRRKSIQPISAERVRVAARRWSPPARRAADADRAAAGRSSAWWLTVLWSVTASKSSPAATASAASSTTGSAPSECTVCAWKSPASQRRPSARAGRAGRPLGQRRQPSAGTRGSPGTAATGPSRPSPRRRRRPAGAGAAEHDLPLAGLQLARAVAGGRPVAVIANSRRAPPDQPRKPSGPSQPRSRTPRPTVDVQPTSSPAVAAPARRPAA